MEKERFKDQIVYGSSRMGVHFTRYVFCSSLALHCLPCDENANSCYTCAGYRTYKKTSTQIRVNLFDILEIDEKNMTVRCEPMVSMGDISHYLIPRGYTIPVVPEMDDLTVGV